jgi:Putative phage tail protein
MVDPSRIYVWAWDARPFPAFPLDAGVWRDGENWKLGHWLNGRLSGVTCGDLISAVLSDHGLPSADVANADGSMHGYVVSDPSSARATLEPVADLFGLAVSEVGGKLVFRREGLQSASSLSVTELVVEDQGPVVEVTRVPDHQLPAEAILGFRDPLNDYQTASARMRREGSAGNRQETIGFPGVLEAGEAAALLDDWLLRTWSRRETITFAVPAPHASVEPGTVVRLPEIQGSSEFLVTDVEDGLIRKGFGSAGGPGIGASVEWRPAGIQTSASHNCRAAACSVSRSADDTGCGQCLRSVSPGGMEPLLAKSGHLCVARRIPAFPCGLPSARQRPSVSSWRR